MQRIRTQIRWKTPPTITKYIIICPERATNLTMRQRKTKQNTTIRGKKIVFFPFSQQPNTRRITKFINLKSAKSTHYTNHIHHSHTQISTRSKQYETQNLSNCRRTWPGVIGPTIIILANSGSEFTDFESAKPLAFQELIQI